MSKPSYTFASKCNLPTLYGVLEMRVYHAGEASDKETIVMVARVRHGQYVRDAPAGTRPYFDRDAPLNSIVVRAHDQCQTSEVFGSVKCDCRQQLEYALELLCHRSRRAWLQAHGGDADSEGSAGETIAAHSPKACGLAGSLPAGASGSTFSLASIPDTLASGDAHAPVISTGACASSPSAALGDEDIVGVVVYLKQEGRGIGLAAKVSAYALQECSDGCIEGFTCAGVPATASASTAGASASAPTVVDTAVTASGGAAADAGAGKRSGLDTVDANRALGLPDDTREYGAVVDVLRDLGLAPEWLSSAATVPSTALTGIAASSSTAAASSAPTDTSASATDLSHRPLYLLSNNPRKLELLRSVGLKVKDTVPCHVPPPSPLAANYMRAKAERMGHAIPSSVWGTGAASPALDLVGRE